MISDARWAKTLAHWVARPERTAKGVAGNHSHSKPPPTRESFGVPPTFFLSSMKLKLFLLLLLFAPFLSGCSHNELFSCIDRHCFIADWTNHHSCVSCCRHGSWDWFGNNECPHCRK
jgi:hypothetical protein